MSLEAFSKLKQPGTGGLNYFVGAHVGGAGIKMRFTDANDSTNFVDLPLLKAQDTVSLLGQVRRVSNEFDNRFKKSICRGAVVSIAGPVKEGETGVLTNWAGRPDARTISVHQLPVKLFPTGQTHFVNDVHAHSYGLIEADNDGSLNDKFQQIWIKQSKRGPMISQKRTCVLTVGSGMGVAVILKDPLLKTPFVFSSEMGHLHVPSILDEETKLIKYISHENYNDRSSPEFEDIVSDRGLAMLYQYHYFEDHEVKIQLDEIDTKDIINLARKSNVTAKKALNDHYKYLSRAAKLLAPTIGCDSVLISHESYSKNNWYFNSIQDDLYNEFKRFSRPQWMQNIRIYNQVKDFDFNVIGASYLAKKFAEN